MQNFEMELLQERNNRLESDLRYTERQLSRENKNSNWQIRRIRQFEEEVAKLKNRTLWQQILSQKERAIAMADEINVRSLGRRCWMWYWLLDML
jgi:hypothetical protein